MHRGFLKLAAMLAALAVALGAFGAHGLKAIVPPETVTTFETGVRYQFYHSLALLFTAMLFEKFPQKIMLWAGYLFVAGILLFSGSLYLLTLLKATDRVGLGYFGIITPFGGLAFIGGWICLLIAFLKK